MSDGKRAYVDVGGHPIPHKAVVEHVLFVHKYVNILKVAVDPMRAAEAGPSVGAKVTRRVV